MMPNIQMCTAVTDNGQVCQVAHECYRHTAKASLMQAWGPPGERFDPKQGCDNHLPMRGDKEWD